jgi:hypothetical protein
MTTTCSSNGDMHLAAYEVYSSWLDALVPAQPIMAFQMGQPQDMETSGLYLLSPLVEAADHGKGGP